MGSVRGVGLFALYRKSAFKASPADDIEEKGEERTLACSLFPAIHDERAGKKKEKRRRKEWRL
jgi:hypothetical protein